MFTKLFNNLMVSALTLQRVKFPWMLFLMHFGFRKAQPKHYQTSVVVRRFAPRPCLLLKFGNIIDLAYIQPMCPSFSNRRGLGAKRLVLDCCQKRPNQCLSLDWTKLKWMHSKLCKFSFSKVTKYHLQVIVCNGTNGTQPIGKIYNLTSKNL